MPGIRKSLVFRIIHSFANSKFINKGNSSIPLFEIYRSIENQTRLQTKTEGNTSNVRGELKHNRNTTLKSNTHRNEL